MTPSIIVVDDFYKQPNTVRSLAINAEYAPVYSLSPNFAGRESAHSYYTESVVSALSGLVQSRIEVDPQKNAFGRFRLAKQGDARRTRVHFDNTKWSAVLYLTPPEHCAGGTVFFKHKATGLYGPPNDGELNRLGYLSRQDFDSNVVAEDTLVCHRWDESVRVSMAYNRLVVFRGSELFHGSDFLFGHTSEDCRLTQVFFFNTLDQESPR